MKKRLQIFYNVVSSRYLSKWIVLCFDLGIVFLSVFIAYVTRLNFELWAIDWQQLWFGELIFLVAALISILIFKSHAGIIRHTGIKDALKTFESMSLTLAIVLVISFLDSKVYDIELIKIPYSVSLIFYLTSIFLLLFSRLWVKHVFHVFNFKKKERINVLIIGAGELGMVVKNTLGNGGASNYQIVGYADENPGKVGKTIEGIRVYNLAAINEDFIGKKGVDEVIFAIKNITTHRRQQMVDEFIKLPVVIKNVPPVDKWMNGELQAKQIEKIQIEDLLQREPIQIKNPRLKVVFKNQVVLVTGAAGSIGSELVNQLARYWPAKLVLVDQAETPLFELKQVLDKTLKTPLVEVVYIIADVSNRTRMEWIFDEHKPDFVFHAAAYKHVPMMEENPFEAIRVNVFGTRIIADLALKYKVDRFVMISTDKAVNPTNVMGASKRLAEMYCQQLGGKVQKTKTRFITTRFGNVLGSNGSVIKIFRDQIECGGPVTVTHPEIIRFFMTIPEACQLVLEAGIMGEESQVFIFDMGAAVKIVDLAINMIRLAGFQPDKDISIEYTGLRPGEKLYEELLTNGENTIGTYHPKIMIAKVESGSRTRVSEAFTGMVQALKNNDPYKIVAILKAAIPEYISNNSVFQKLDNPKHATHVDPQVASTVES